MKLCEFRGDVCAVCGATKRNVRQVCLAGGGLGDIVAAGLTAVGITKERVEAAVGRPCGCDKRKEMLNRLGRKLGIGGPGNGKETSEAAE